MNLQALGFVILYGLLFVLLFFLSYPLTGKEINKYVLSSIVLILFNSLVQHAWIEPLLRRANDMQRFNGKKTIHFVSYKKVVTLP